MGRHKSKTLTPVELEIMQVVWAGGEVSAEEVRLTLRQQRRRLHNASVRKMLSILLEKGYVQRRKISHRYVYVAKVSQKRAEKSLLADLHSRVFGGDTKCMMQAFLNSRLVSAKDLKAIKQLIAEKERASK